MPGSIVSMQGESRDMLLKGGEGSTVSASTSPSGNSTLFPWGPCPLFSANVVGSNILSASGTKGLTIKVSAACSTCGLVEAEPSTRWLVVCD